jgi:anti-sigma regulatory factor (Ser/Thr protein kinase)
MSAAAARRFLRDRLNDWGYPLAQAETPCLLLSELVTNAVVHTRTPVGLELRLAGRRLRCAVADESRRVPVPRPCKETDDAGRGLQLVEELAAEWGVETYTAGKAVWFEVDLAARDRLRSR